MLGNNRDPFPDHLPRINPDVLSRILADATLHQALVECCARGLLHAEGRRIRLRPNRKGSRLKFTAIIEPNFEAIPAEDWRGPEVFLSEMDGRVQLRVNRTWLMPEPVPQSKAWDYVRFDLNELLEFAAKAGARPTAPAPSAAGRSTSLPPKRRRGPKPGTIDRYGAADRALFPDIAVLVAQGISVTEAVDRLPMEKIKGRGGLDSRRKRLVARYLREKDSRT